MQHVSAHYISKPKFPKWHACRQPQRGFEFRPRIRATQLGGGENSSLSSAKKTPHWHHSTYWPP
ncbi:hypothetical protein BC937DRAFT_94763 [Endogone sp. FLAS-F59071]|nr:hypothetical protein BC937DRAFT_94763 [Endogone sp. FLAS-F59071]|eukprot:RUS13797.1 hypothetical protein BC937DRAFT_94763 [Endogone sp. FLAS-F59071]